MPTPQLKALADKSGKSLADIERYWDEAKKSAAEQGHSEDYAYIVGIVKRRAGMSESETKLGLILRMVEEDRNPPFITSNGGPYPIKFGDLTELPRYGVWTWDDRKGAYQVTDTSNDLKALMRKYNIPFNRVQTAKKTR